jgi:hypothetical protein
LCQSATLTGLGGSTFAKSVQNIQDINQIFARNFPQGALEDWNPTTFEGHPAIDMNNRFFTLRKQTTTEEIIPLSGAVDPYGILSDSMGLNDQFVHTMENEVEYYQLVNDSEQEIK